MSILKWLSTAQGANNFPQLFWCTTEERLPVSYPGWLWGRAPAAGPRQKTSHRWRRHTRSSGSPLAWNQRGREDSAYAMFVGAFYPCLHTGRTLAIPWWLRPTSRRKKQGMTSPAMPLDLKNRNVHRCTGNCWTSCPPGQRKKPWLYCMYNFSHANHPPSWLTSAFNCGSRGSEAFFWPQRYFI